MKRVLFLVVCQCVFLLSAAFAEKAEWVRETYDFSQARRVCVELELPDALAESVEGDMAYDILWEKLETDVVRKLPKDAYAFVPTAERVRHPDHSAVFLKRLDPAGKEIHKVELLKDTEKETDSERGRKRPVSLIIPQETQRGEPAEPAAAGGGAEDGGDPAPGDDSTVRDDCDLVLRVRVRDWDTDSRYREGYYRLVPVREYRHFRDGKGNVHTISTLDYEYRYEPPRYVYTSHVAVSLRLYDAATGKAVWSKTDRRARAGTDVASMYRRIIGSFCGDFQKRLKGDRQ